MTVTDVKDLVLRRTGPRLLERLRTLMTGEQAAAQRMAAIAFVIRVMSAVVVFLTQILLARWMGGFEFGIYVSVWTWLLLAGDTIHLGLPITAQRFIPEYTQSKSFDLLRGFLIGSRWITFVSGTIAALLGAAIVHTIETRLDRHLIMPFYLACVSLPFYTLSNTLDGLARSFNWVNVALVPPYVIRPLILVSVMAAAYLFGLTTDATTAMAALAIGTWFAALLQLLLLQRRLAAAVAPGPRAYDLRRWLVTSIPTMVVWGFFTLLTYTDVLVLQQFHPPEEVAHYYAAAKTLALVAFIYFSVAAATAHRITAFHVAGDRDGLVAFTANAVRWTFWPSLAAIVGILAIGKPVLWLFGPAFTVAYPLMFVLAGGLLARAAVGPAERVLNMLGEQRVCALIYSGAFATNLGLALLLAPRYGGLGVAIALTSAIFVESGLLFLVAKRRLGLHLFIWRPRHRPVAASG